MGEKKEKDEEEIDIVNKEIEKELLDLMAGKEIEQQERPKESIFQKGLFYLGVTILIIIILVRLLPLIMSLK